MAEHIEVFNHPHNWSTPLVENYEFKTDIVTSQSGREQLIDNGDLCPEYAHKQN